MGRRPPEAEFLGREVPGYSGPRLQHKLARHALAAGREVVEKVLWLYYASRRPDVPRWAKLTIYAALAYFILPLDAIPDPTPLAGYADDLGALSAALLTVATYVDEGVKQKARRRLQKWFGAPPGGTAED
ncbi:MAG: hypothetical protein CALGDGBN_02853 [Pseudomonadales bacterium]|nr:hypothetical protein [Pseudomonadales bacterium]